MVKVSRDFDFTSEEVKEILNEPPAWILRSGSIALFGILVTILLLCSVVKYPSVINGDLKLTTKDHPIKIVSKVPGMIEKLFVSDSRRVENGETLAIIENPVSAEEIDFLKNFIVKAESFLFDDSMPLNFIENKYYFGYLQDDYNSLIKRLIDYDFFRNSEYYKAKIKTLKQQIGHYDKLQRIMRSQLVLNNSELSNCEEKYKIDRDLFQSQVISKIEFVKVENDFLEQKQQSEILKRQIEEISITSLEHHRQLDDLVFEVKQKDLQYQESIKESLKIIGSSVQNWEQSYVIKAPRSGMVHYLKEITEKQHVNLNDEIFLIVPLDEKFLCLVDVSPYGFGKVRV